MYDKMIPSLRRRLIKRLILRITAVIVVIVVSLSIGISIIVKEGKRNRRELAYEKSVRQGKLAEAELKANAYDFVREIDRMEKADMLDAIEEERREINKYRKYKD